MEQNYLYQVRIGTAHIWGRDLAFDVYARNSRHAIVRVAHAFEAVCRNLEYDILDLDGRPFKFVPLDYSAVQVMGL